MIRPKALKSLPASSFNFLLKLHKPLIAVLILGLGILLGFLFSSPSTTQLPLSLLTFLVVTIAVFRDPLNGLLLWLFFEPFIETWVEIPMGAGLPDLSFSRFIAMLLVVFMLARATIGRFRFVPLSLADISILATTVGIMVAAPNSVQPISTVQRTIALIFIPLCTYFIAKNLVRDRKGLRKLFWTIAFMGFVFAAYAAYENATGNVLFVPQDRLLGNLYRQELDIRIIRGILGNSNNMGRALAASIPVTFYLFLERRRGGTRKTLLAVMLAVQFYGIIIAMARAPWYALLIALLVMQFFYPQFRKLFVVIALVGAVVIWVTWDQVVDSDINRRINDENSTLEGRQARWSAGVNMWKAKPIQGWGFGRFETQSGRFRTDGIRQNFKNGAVENDYLYTLIASGLIGFLPYLIFLLAPLVNSLRLFYRARAPTWAGFIKPEMLTVYWAVILCFLITSYTAVQLRPTIRSMTFAVAGAVVGSHEHFVLRAKEEMDERS